MTEVASNISALLDMEVDASQAAEVDAILKAAGDDKIWDSIDKSCDAGAGQPTTKAGVPIPTPVNPNDPHMIEIAKFAVKKNNEQSGTSMMFVRVIGGLKWKVYVATAYALLISVEDNKVKRTGKALVIEAITGHNKLVWWKN